jgi:cytidylate kinase
MLEQNLFKQKSREYVEKITRQRQLFVKKHFHANIDDPVNYDIVINTAFIEPKTISEIVKTVLKRKKFA